MFVDLKTGPSVPEIVCVLGRERAVRRLSTHDDNCKV
jgi:hypothetical protein